MDEAQRLAYEERLEDERRQDREREDAYRESLEEEDARRLDRYDEAIRLLRLAKFEKEHWHEADAFLAAEPKEGEGA
jgi:hypothetical protein